MMRLCVIVTVATLLGGDAGFTQVTLPDMSAQAALATPASDTVATPSPIGGMSTEASIGGGGIPLGVAELYAGGLSPSPSDLSTPSPTCPGAGPNPGVGTLGTGSIFAGNGTMATSTSDIASSVDPTDSGCGAIPSAGAGPLGLTSPLGAAPAFSGGSVPLGATALSTTGLAGAIGASTPGGLPKPISQSATSHGTIPLGGCGRDDRKPAEVQYPKLPAFLMDFRQCEPCNETRGLGTVKCNAWAICVPECSARPTVPS
jgi:hypothetical protein